MKYQNKEMNMADKIFCVLAIIIAILMWPMGGSGQETLDHPEGFVCPKANPLFIASDTPYERLDLRRLWKIRTVEANPSFGLSEGIVLYFKGEPVLRIGHEGISRFFFWDSPGDPFEIDCHGRLKVSDPCHHCRDFD